MSALRLWLVTAFAFVGLASVAVPAAHAQTHLKLAPQSPEQIAQLLQNYYRAPVPEHIAGVLQQAMALGLAETRARRLALIGFMAGLIADDVGQLERLAAVFGKLPGDQSERLVRAVLYSGRADWKELIVQLKGLWPDKIQDIDRIAAHGARPVYALKRAGQPEVLDMNWAYFGATGRREAVMYVVETLGDLRASDPQAVVMAHAARLSLASQAMNHDLVVEICRRALMGSYGTELTAVLTAAQSRDLARIKADAADATKAAQTVVPAPAEAMAATARKP